MLEWFFPGSALLDACSREEGEVLDLRIPVPSNRRFACRAGVANVKMPLLLAFARHVETETVKVQKPMSVTLNGQPGTVIYNRCFEEFGEGTRLAMSKTICTPDSIVIEAWFRGY